MTLDNHERVAAQIEFAHESAAQGVDDVAAKAFALARGLAVSMCDPKLLAQRVTGTFNGLSKEREVYRSLIARRRTADQQLVVLADSLGLPRPDDKSGSAKGADRTYPLMMLDRLPQHAVESHCQRYFTTADIIDLLQADPALAASSDVVIHLGLNDCANRMFLERERLALDLLPAETKDRVVGFAQKHRRLLLRNLPSSHYVDPDSFRTNLDTIFHLLRERQAKRVVLATIILPPERFWQATPGIQGNFARYNLILMEATERHDGLVLDIDRHVWARQHEGALLPDGMHLSEAGHALFADQLAALLA